MRKPVGTSRWSPLIVQWKAQQETLRERLRVEPIVGLPRLVAGVDAAFSPDKKQALAAAVVWDREARKVIEISHAVLPVEVPYIPGFLSFREGPVVTAALGKLTHPYELVMFDGQGYAHPRRCGLATFVGVQLDVPAIGVGKSRLIGTHEAPAEQAGATTPLMDEDEQIGVVLRTQDNVRPIYVSIGHRVDLKTAVKVVMACSTRYRIPEPTRNADREVSLLKRSMMGK